MVVTVTREGYIKRTALSEYREQKRGGKGTQGMNTKETDVVTNLFVTNTHTPLLFFSSDGFITPCLGCGEYVGRYISR